MILSVVAVPVQHKRIFPKGSVAAECVNVAHMHNQNMLESSCVFGNPAVLMDLLRCCESVCICADREWGSQGQAIRSGTRGVRL